MNDEDKTSNSQSILASSFTDDKSERQISREKSNRSLYKSLSRFKLSLPYVGIRYISYELKIYLQINGFFSTIRAMFMDD